VAPQPSCHHHDELAAISAPFYFHQYMEQAAARGLQFLSERPG
jgi:hypothetical protein